MMMLDSPASSRSMAARRKSRPSSADPTFSLNALKPWSMARSVSARDLVVVISHPARRCVITGIAVTEDCFAARAGGHIVVQQRDRIGSADHVLHAAEIE